MAESLTAGVWDAVCREEPPPPAPIFLLCIAQQKRNWLCMVDGTCSRHSDGTSFYPFGRVFVTDDQLARMDGPPKNWMFKIKDYKVDLDGRVLQCKSLDKIQWLEKGVGRSLLHPGLKAARIDPYSRTFSLFLYGEGAPGVPSAATLTPAANDQYPAQYPTQVAQAAPTTLRESGQYAAHARPPQQLHAHRATPYEQQPPGRSTGPVLRTDAAALMTIKDLSQYTARWQVKAKVLVKSDIRKYSNQKGEGRFFSVDLMDRSGESIRGTFFNKACDRFEAYIQEGKTYMVGRGNLGPSNKCLLISSIYQICLRLPVNSIDFLCRANSAHKHFLTI